MNQINLEQFVNNAGDNVQQLVAAVNGQKTLKNIEGDVRVKATKDVETYLRNNEDGYDYSHKGTLPWKGLEITVKHKKIYTWDNYRKSPKSDSEKSLAELELERNVDLALETRLLRKQLLESAEAAYVTAQANLRAAKMNYRDSEETLERLLPNSKCIHDELQIAVP